MGYYEKLPLDAETEVTPLAGRSRHSSSTQLSGLPAARVQIICVCMLYAVVGPTLVLTNNHILKNLNFPFPLFLSALGLITTSVVCTVVLRVAPSLGSGSGSSSSGSSGSSSSSKGGADTPSGDVSPAEELQQHGSIAMREMPREPLSRLSSDSDSGGGGGSGAGGGGEGGSAPSSSSSSSSASASKGITLRFWLRNMVPIGAAQGVTFASTNAAYMYLTITFTQMLAAFTPTVTLVLLYLFGVETPTRRASGAVILIGLGCALSSYGEGHFDLVGVAFRSLGIFSEATRLVLTQHLLKNHKLSVFESQYYLAPIGAAFLLTGAAFNETGKAYRGGALGIIAAHPLLFASSAALGVVASMLTFLVIKLTNSVTLKVINTARNAAFVLFTVTLLGEEASRLQVFGYCISLFAFSAYTYFKLNKM